MNCSPRKQIILGADAQDVLGPLDLHDNRTIVGENVETVRGAKGIESKGIEFLRICEESRLQIHNTMYRDPQGSHTCHYYLKKASETN